MLNKMKSRRWISRTGRFILSLLVSSLAVYHLSINSSFSTDLRNIENWFTKSPTDRQCQPIDRIVFLKTHKCASSTIQRILFRYGKPKYLDFALPESGNYLGSPNLFNQSMLPEEDVRKSRKFDVFAIHTRLHVDNIKSVMKDGAKWVTILRNPVDQFLSSWYYYGFSKHFNMSLAEFLRDPSNPVIHDRIRHRIGTNQMLFDLGLSSPELWNEYELLYKIKEFEDVFDLVMIVELFDESLVLLKHLMCWSTEDVTYLKINLSRKRKSTEKVADGLIHGIKRLNAADLLLYQLFRSVLEDKILEFGEKRMAKEVQELRTANQKMQDRCVLPETEEEKMARIFSFDKPKNKTYILKNDSSECTDLVLGEMRFIKKLIGVKKVFSSL